jgi:adenylosuccinate lyase
MIGEDKINVTKNHQVDFEINKLNAISPIDGRYRGQVEELAKYFSEGALIKYRVRVEVEYFIALCKLPLNELKNFDAKQFPSLRMIYEEFKDEDARRIKDLEKTTNHDVKAVEYFLKEEFKRLGLEKFKEFIHFGLTSQDINNTATPLLLKEAVLEVYKKEIHHLISLLINFLKIGMKSLCLPEPTVSLPLPHVLARKLKSLWNDYQVRKR